MDIDEILLDINEDKFQNNATTSNKFKKDVWNFFKKINGKVVVEFGTHKGQTTKVLSHLFDKVYTINNNDSIVAKKLNSELNNITYLNFDLYSGLKPTINDTIDVFLIDAGHKYEHVISDFNLATSLNCSEDCYIIFDDYGCNIHKNGVKRAVDLMISNGFIEVVQRIGYSDGYQYAEDKVFDESEGLITKVIWQ
jgi:hypothetical protein